MLLNVNELKKNYGLDDQKLCCYLLDGIPCYRIGDSVRFPKGSVEKWLEQYQNKQEILEANFVDSKGRTIEEYISRKELSEVLRIREKELAHLTLNGMPFVTIGEKIFYSLDDVLNYFKVKEKNNPSPLNIKVQKNEPMQIIAVDGSYIAKEKKLASGVIWQTAEETIGYSYSYSFGSNYSTFSEWLAILEALRIVEENDLKKVVILTDQKGHLKYLNNSELPYPKSALKERHFTQSIDEINTLLKKLGNRVTFRYAKENPYAQLYNQAHKLSQKHENKVFKPLLEVV